MYIHIRGTKGMYGNSFHFILDFEQISNQTCCIIYDIIVLSTPLERTNMSLTCRLPQNCLPCLPCLLFDPFAV